MTEAEKQFTGLDWDASWTDWKKRLAAMKRKSGSVGSAPATKGAK
jgi:hypothetical protein